MGRITKKLTPYNKKGIKFKFEAEENFNGIKTRKNKELAKNANRSLKKSLRQENKKYLRQYNGN
jgi:ABC-type uncharacterized transport system ATPase subunit